MDLIKKIKALKLRWKIVSGVLALIILFWFFHRGGNQAGQTARVERKNIVQEVLVSGKIQPTQKVDLAFESGGTVKQIARQAGDAVKTGDLIASLDLTELSVTLERQQAALEQARLALATLVEPPKAIDQTAAEHQVSASQDALTQAQDDGNKALSEALVVLPTTLNTIHDLATVGSGYLSDNEVRYVGDRALAYKTQVETSYWLADGAYQQAKKNPNLENVYQTTKLIASALKNLYALIVYLEDQNSGNVSTELTADKATLATDTDEINTHLAALLAAQNGIDQTSRALTDTQNKLQDLLDGADKNDVTTEQLKVRQAELDVQDTQVQLTKRQIRAPFDGLVGHNDLELGQIVTAGTPAVTVISANQNEVVAKVPEAEISKIKIGDPATVTLDAYAAEQGVTPPLAARVAAIDPAEVIVDGVATYKVTLQFVSQSEQARSGMTANLTIIGAQKNDVLTIPARALSVQNGTYVVNLLRGGKTITQPVTVGLRGSAGEVEIISGLSLGDEVNLCCQN